MSGTLAYGLAIRLLVPSYAPVSSAVIEMHKQAVFKVGTTGCSDWNRTWSSILLAGKRSAGLSASYQLVMNLNGSQSRESISRTIFPRRCCRSGGAGWFGDVGTQRGISRRSTRAGTLLHRGRATPGSKA